LLSLIHVLQKAALLGVKVKGRQQNSAKKTSRDSRGNEKAYRIGCSKLHTLLFTTKFPAVHPSFNVHESFLVPQKDLRTASCQSTLEY